MCQVTGRYVRPVLISNSSVVTLMFITVLLAANSLFMAVAYNGNMFNFNSSLWLYVSPVFCCLEFVVLSIRLVNTVWNSWQCIRFSELDRIRLGHQVKDAWVRSGENWPDSINDCKSESHGATHHETTSTLCQSNDSDPHHVYFPLHETM